MKILNPGRLEKPWSGRRLFRFNYILTDVNQFMARIGIIIVVGAMVISMAAAMYAYTLYQTNYIEVNEGDKVTVGPVEYSVMFDGTHGGSETVQANNTFVQIMISAENISDERTPFSGGQLYILDKDGKRQKAMHGAFSSKDLLVEWLEPGEPVERTTQFDIPFDDEYQYKIVIRPQKEQSTVDTAIICITNCQ